MIALKRNGRSAGMHRRRFFTAEWKNGRATEPVSALIPDEYDDTIARAKGFQSADYYGVALMPMDTFAVGFLWNFRHMMPLGVSEKAGGHHGRNGRCDISLVYQLERHGRWLHVAGRPDWMCAEDMPEWARGALYSASSPVDVGDESWLYFTGTSDRHGWCGVGIDIRRWREHAARDGGFAKIGLAKWPKHRLLGYRSIFTDRITLNPSADIIAGSSTQPELLLNVDTEPDGRVRAALVDGQTFEAFPGFSMKDCLGAHGSHLAVPVRWKGNPSLPQLKPNQAVLAQVELTKATLFAFEFSL